MKKMIERFPIANFKASIRGQGTAKILLRRALYALGKKVFLLWQMDQSMLLLEI